MDSPAGVRTKVKCGSILLDDFVLDFHHGKIEVDLGLGRFGGEIAADNLCEQLTCLLKQIPLHLSAIGGILKLFHHTSHMAHQRKCFYDGNGGYSSLIGLKNSRKHIKTLLSKCLISILGITSCFYSIIF